MSAPLLSVEGLCVAFAGVRVVADVSISVGVGEAVGVVGESGSGKSVTALSVLRLIPSPPGQVEAGRVMFQGTDLLGLPLARMREIRGRDIAMVFQEPMASLNPVMTVGEQIAEAVMLHGDLDRAARRARAIEMLGLVGIPDPAGRYDAYPHQFSGGMRQRVMIAIALACNPRLLIADEPTTALDVTIQAQVLDLLKRIRAQFGTAILLISHDLGVIADICERVVVMYAGRVVEEADVRAIFRTPAHPYTRGLLASIPRLDDTCRRLHQIPGTVPNAARKRPGCPFAPRCPLREARCEEAMPPMVAHGPGQRAACWVTAP